MSMIETWKYIFPIWGEKYPDQEIREIYKIVREVDGLLHPMSEGSWKYRSYPVGKRIRRRSQIQHVVIVRKSPLAEEACLIPEEEFLLNRDVYCDKNPEVHTCWDRRQGPFAAYRDITSARIVPNRWKDIGGWRPLSSQYFIYYGLGVVSKEKELYYYDRQSILGKNQLSEGILFLDEFILIEKSL